MAAKLSSTITHTVHKTPAILAALRSLASKQVMVGIPSNRAGRRTAPGETINNAALGYIHENGASEAGIPPRPFLVPGVRGVQAGTAARFRQALEVSLDGRENVADQYLNAAGLEVVNAVRNKIQQGPFVPLRPATLAARRRRGRTGTLPLIDTGQLRNSITYVIRRLRSKP